MNGGTDTDHQHSSSAATPFHPSPWLFLWRCQTDTLLYEPVKSGPLVKICFLNPLSCDPINRLLMKSIFPFIHFIPAVWCLNGKRRTRRGFQLFFMYVLMFNCRHQCFPPSLFFPSSPLQLDSCNKSLMEPGTNQHPAEWREKARRPPEALITPCLGIKPAPLCRITCDGGTSDLTESAGNGVTSRFFTSPWLHQSTVGPFLSWQVSGSENGWRLGPSHDSRWLFVQCRRQHTGLVVTMTAWQDRWGGWHAHSPQVEVLMKSLGCLSCFGG